MDFTNTVVDATSVQFSLGITLTIALALAGFYLAFRFLHRYRIMQDIPTSKVRSAAQGYTELEGTAKLMPGTPITSPLSGIPCAWYRYSVEERQGSYSDTFFGDKDNNHWRTIEKGVSDGIFHLEDDTGKCIIDPEGAEVIPNIRLRWYGRYRRPHSIPTSNNPFKALFFGGRYRYTEQRIHDNSTLYAIGEFHSIGGVETDTTLRSEARDLLALWKRDQQTLLKRFDQNGDGEIDMQEWDLARQQALQETKKSHREQAKRQQLHILKKPIVDRQPFLLSAEPQATLISRYMWFTSAAVTGFLIAGIISTWAIHIRLQ